MNKFIITIEETVSQEFEVEAENAELAVETAKNKYRNGEFTLEPGEVCFKQMTVVKPYNEVTEWIEF